MGTSFDSDYSDRNQSGTRIHSPIVTHDKPEFGSRTSISQLPPLPGQDVYQYNSSDEDQEKLLDESAKGDDGTRDQSFVEFDLSNKHDTSEPKATIRDASERKEDIQEAQDLDDHESRLEETHKQPMTKADKIKKSEDDFFNDNKASWKTMKTISEMDYYDDKGNLQFTQGRDHDIFDPKNVNSGYTRIDTEEQVAKYAELDKKTDFLFVTKGEINERTKEAKYREDDVDASSVEDLEYEEDENLEQDEALQSTKDMLTEAQKFSYVGMVKLIAVEMATELALIKQSTSSKVARQLSSSQKNFANWNQYINNKIYTHMDLSPEEIKMIDNLSIHGLGVEDLASSLIKKKDDEHSDIPPYRLEWTLICDLLLLLLSDGYYDSRSRALLIRFANVLGIENLEVYQFERRLLNSLDLESKDKTLEDREELLNDKQFIQKYVKKNKGKRMAYVGLATLGGTLAIGLSAGLLAPVIGAGLAAGLTTVGIGGTGGFLAGVGGSALITTGGVVLGATAGHKAGSRRVGEVQTFELKPLHNNKRSNLIITVSGWMIGKADDVRLPFSTVDPVMGDLFSVLWEPEMLRSMGQTIGILATEALTSSIQQILGATIASSLIAAIQLPVALSKLSYLVDNPWNVSLDRAWKAGKILADTLISGNMGVRPVTLVGFSLGSRVVYSCLIELAHRGCFGLVENVIMLGSPVSVNQDQLGLARSVVSGRFVNGFSRKDWVLGYLFRATSGGLASVAGLSPIKDSYGIENFDATEHINGHMAYRRAIPKILKALNWETLSDEFVEIEEPDAEEGERQRQLILEFDEARNKMKKEIEEERRKEKEAKGWKKFFKNKKDGWWKDMGDHQDASKSEVPIDPAEYKLDENENPTPIFDVSSLQEEANRLQELSKLDKDSLQAIREDVEPKNTTTTADVPFVPINEHTEMQSQPSMLDNLTERVGNVNFKDKFTENTATIKQKTTGLFNKLNEQK